MNNRRSIMSLAISGAISFTASVAVAAEETEEANRGLDLRLEVMSMPSKIDHSMDGTARIGSSYYIVEDNDNSRWDGAGRLNLLALFKPRPDMGPVSLLLGGAVALTGCQNSGDGYKETIGALGVDGMVGVSVDVGEHIRFEVLPFVGLGSLSYRDKYNEPGLSFSGDGTGAYFDYGIRCNVVLCQQREIGPQVALGVGYIGLKASVSDYEGKSTDGSIYTKTDDDFTMSGGFGAVALGWRF